MCFMSSLRKAAEMFLWCCFYYWYVTVVLCILPSRAFQTQILCYLQLILVSYGDDSSSSSSTEDGSYSLISVAAAMYLMTSIAAADLGAGIALISEARMDMATKRWVQRKMLGFMLLAAASIRVLFKTSSEDGCGSCCRCCNGPLYCRRGEQRRWNEGTLARPSKFKSWMYLILGHSQSNWYEYFADRTSSLKQTPNCPRRFVLMRPRSTTHYTAPIPTNICRLVFVLNLLSNISILSWLS